MVNSKSYSQEQLSLVLEDSSASEDEPIISSEEEEEDVADGEGDGKKKSKVAVVARSGKRCDSPDFHGFESWAAEAEYVKSLEGFRRDNSCRHKKR